MNSLRILVVEETPATLQVIERTLAEAHAKYEVCRDTEDAWRCFQADPDVRCVLVRMKSKSIDGRLLSQRIRGVTTAESLPILMIITEDQIGLTDSAIDSGATEIMVDPFEPRELRMRTSIPSNPRNLRIDEPHQFAVAEEHPSPCRNPRWDRSIIRNLSDHCRLIQVLCRRGLIHSRIVSRTMHQQASSPAGTKTPPLQKLSSTKSWSVPVAKVFPHFARDADVAAAR